MKSSRQPNSHERRKIFFKVNSCGFTLIELLIVVFLVGVLLGAAALSSGVAGNRHSLADQADRLTSLFAQLRRRALTENREFGFSVDHKGRYHWWQLQQETSDWQRLSEKPWQMHSLPDGLNLELSLINSSPNKTVKGSAKSDNQPVVVVFSDWQLTPFILRLSDDKGLRITMTTDGYNNVEVTP